jgi:hypothetical protein
MLYTAIVNGNNHERSIAWPFTGRHRVRLTSYQSYGSTAFSYVLITSRTVVNPMQPEFLFVLNSNFDVAIDGSGGWARSGWMEIELSGVYDFQIRNPTGSIVVGPAVIVVLQFEIEKI